MDSVYSFTTKLIAKHNNDIDEFIKCEIYKALGSEKRVYTFNDKLIIEAVEKAIPQKPVLQECDFFNVRLVCPKCKKPIVNLWNQSEYKPNFCHYCGKAFDWENEVEKCD